MKHLKKFDSQTEYQNFLSSDDFILPNISLILENNTPTMGYHPGITIPAREPQLLTLTSLDDNNHFSIYCECGGGSGSGSGSGGDINTYDNEKPYIQYTYDEEEWYEFVFGDVSGNQIDIPPLNANESVKLRGNILSGLQFYTNEGRIAASGDVTSLSNGIGGDIDCEFDYSNMFSGCTSLITAPELPATTLADGCYRSMFNGCTSLTTAPELPAITLTTQCYDGMFYGCTNLNYVKAMFTTTPGSSYTDNWLTNVAASGTFVKNSAATWTTTGASGVPEGWTVQTAAA